VKESKLQNGQIIFGFRSTFLINGFSIWSRVKTHVCRLPDHVPRVWTLGVSPEVDGKLKHAGTAPVIAMSSIALDYKINPPAPLQAKNISASKTTSFPVDASRTDGQTKYYGSLHEAIRKAKDELGSDLTIWRDAVGKAEDNKETTKTLSYGEEEELEEEDGQ
jgi:hypothetical protein